MAWTRYKGNKGNKYGNVKVERDGVKFDSKLERTMYDMLKKFNIPFEFQVTEELHLSETQQAKQSLGLRL